MVKKEPVLRKEIVLISALAVLISGIILVLAAGSTTMHSPSQFYNYSTTMNVTCAAVINDTVTTYNVTILYNASGGNASTSLVTISNTTQNQSWFENSSTGLYSTVCVEGIALYDA